MDGMDYNSDRMIVGVCRELDFCDALDEGDDIGKLVVFNTQDLDNNNGYLMEFDKINDGSKRTTVYKYEMVDVSVIPDVITFACRKGEALFDVNIDIYRDSQGTVWCSIKHADDSPIRIFMLPDNLIVQSNTEDDNPMRHWSKYRTYGGNHVVLDAFFKLHKERDARLQDAVISIDEIGDLESMGEMRGVESSQMLNELSNVTHRTTGGVILANQLGTHDNPFSLGLTVDSSRGINMSNDYDDRFESLELRLRAIESSNADGDSG